MTLKICHPQHGQCSLIDDLVLVFHGIIQACIQYLCLEQYSTVLETARWWLQAGLIILSSNPCLDRHRPWSWRLLLSRVSISCIIIMSLDSTEEFAHKQSLSKSTWCLLGGTSVTSRKKLKIRLEIDVLHSSNSWYHHSAASVSRPMYFNSMFAYSLSPTKFVPSLKPSTTRSWPSARR